MTPADLVHAYVWAATFRYHMLALDTRATPEQRAECAALSAKAADIAADEARRAYRAVR